jgi:hypothetical protein
VKKRDHGDHTPLEEARQKEDWNLERRVEVVRCHPHATSSPWPPVSVGNYASPLSCVSLSSSQGPALPRPAKFSERCSQSGVKPVIVEVSESGFVGSSTLFSSSFELLSTCLTMRAPDRKRRSRCRHKSPFPSLLLRMTQDTQIACQEPTPWSDSFVESTRNEHNLDDNIHRSLATYIDSLKNVQ